MKFIFLIALFSLIFCGFEDDWGCEVTGGSNRCCWISEISCCKPPEGERFCLEERTKCCKKRQYSMEDGEYFYFYTGGTDSDED